MKKTLTCPLCHEKVYSGVGNGCKMCGMPLGDKEEFCSNLCQDHYRKIHKERIIK